MDAFPWIPFHGKNVCVRSIPAVEETEKFAPSRMAGVCDFIIRWGLVFLMGFTPLVFGSVQPWAYYTMETVVLVLLAAWTFKMALEGDLRFAWLSIFVPLALFILVVSFQLLSLPSVVISTLSPNTHDLYLRTVPGYAEAVGTVGKFWNGFNRPLSVYPFATRQELVKILSYIGVFLLAVNNVQTRRDIRFYLGVLVFFGFAYSLFAIAQKFTWNGKMFWFIDLNPGRDPFGSYINKNHFAGYIGMIIPLAIGLLLSWRLEVPFGGGARRFRFRLAEWGEPGRSRFFLLQVIIAFMVTALLMSLSRGGMVGTASATIAVLLLSFLRGRKKGWSLMLSAVGLFAIFIITWVGYEHYVMGRIIGLWNEVIGRSVRVEIWRDAQPIFKDYLLFGSGLGTFAFIFPLYKTLLLQLHFLHPENDYLLFLIETGLAGGVAILLAVALFVVYVARRLFQLKDIRMVVLSAGGVGSGISMAVHSFLDFNLHIPANAFHFAFILGLLVVMVNLRSGEEKEHLTLTYVRFSLDGRLRILRFVLPLICLSAIWVIPISYEDKVHFENGKRARFRATNAYRRNDLARTRELGREAVRELQRAISVNPLNYIYHYYLGLTAADVRRYENSFSAGQREKTPDPEKIFRRTLRLYPTNANLHHAVAIYYLRHWDSLSPVEQAFGSAAYRRALDLLPNPRERKALKARTKGYLRRAARGKNLAQELLNLVEGK